MRQWLDAAKPWFWAVLDVATDCGVPAVCRRHDPRHRLPMASLGELFPEPGAATPAGR